MKREQIDKAHADDLYAAILQLQTVEEVESFFFDLCTPAELEGIVDRWRVAQMLVRKNTLPPDCGGNQCQHGDHRSCRALFEQRQ